MVSADPMENGAEANKDGKGSGQLVVASRHTAVAFERTEEVLHMVAMMIVAAMKEAPLFPGGIDREAREDVFLQEQRAQGIGIVAFIRDQGAAVPGPEVGHQTRSHGDVGHITGAQEQLQGPALPIHQRVDLGRGAAATEPKRLRALPTSGIETAAMDANVSRIDKTQPPARVSRQPAEDACPQAQVAPAGKVAVSRAPVEGGARQVPPRATRPELIEKCLHHVFQPHRRTPRTFALLPEFTRLWYLHAGTASAPTRVVCGRSSAQRLLQTLISRQAFSNTP